MDNKPYTDIFGKLIFTIRFWLAQSVLVIRYMLLLPNQIVVSLLFSVLVQVNVFGFGADGRGNWHHYWEENRYSGEFRKTGVHDADYEAQLIKQLTGTGKITVFPGK